MIRHLRMFLALALLIAAPATAQMTFSTPGYAVTSGTYTPTLTLTTNVAAASLNASTLAFWSQQGNIVTVSVEVSITPTASSANTVLRISLPVPSNTASVSGNAVGEGWANNNAGPFGGPVSWVLVGGTTGTANYNFFPSTTVAKNHYITFRYLVP